MGKKTNLHRVTRNYLSWLWLFGLSVPAFAATNDDPLLSASAATPITTSSATTEARGVLRAVDQAVLSSELNARVVELPFREGEAFHKGDLLARFDCSAYQAQLAASQAAARAAQEELTQNRQLGEMKSVGRHAIALSEAHLAQAQAESQVYQIQVNRCRTTAPFDGRIVSRKIQVSEYVAQGTPLLDIVDNRHLEIHLLVPSRWLPALKPKQTFIFTPDETGQPLQAEIVRIGARIDESSQTLTLIGRLLKPDNNLLAGMSGNARFTEAP
ncbi:efflux RND transporter periplasmic adaptor subunit [Tolumonas lignilytica]|uniref:efflux RND transporter periplasmic adaptor subunit n=1 Tax=Tolumonas lignilytica TaxID=1283284 RepID=UPI000465D4D7|nr:efflux RND transporter periplasmic adaptor subunit [Tolumonas lignilytica]